MTIGNIQTTAGGVRYTPFLTDDLPRNVVIWDKNGTFKEWHMSELYRGQDNIGDGNIGRFVGNVGDKAWSEDLGTYLIESLNPTTLIPTLRRVREVAFGGADDKNLLLGVGPLYPQEGYFIYVDPLVHPATLAFDSMACFYQVDARYVRIFKGSVKDDPYAKPISAWYDQAGNYVDDKIPLRELEGVEPGKPKKFYVPLVGAVSEIPERGDPVTVVCYNDNNDIVSVSVWLINYGVAYRESFSGNLEISSIELIGPYVKENNQIIVPVDTLVSTASMMMCRVIYTNGQTNDFAIDGDKIKLSGEWGFVSSQPGVPYPVNLIYTLDRTEKMKGATGNNGNFHIVSYTIQTDTKLNAYGMKLFIYPEWISDTRGYRLRAFLQSIDRDAVYEVTDLIEIGVTSAPWDPLLYGTKQRLTVAIDISRVDPRYTGYRHVQNIWITLLADGITKGRTPWLVSYEPGQSPEYGYNVECVLKYTSSQVWETNVTCGYKNQQDWLEHLYYDTKPMYSISNEASIPKPTHFIMVIEGLRYRRPIKDWSTPIITKSGSHPGELCIIHWVQELNGVDLNLATSGLIIRNN